MSIKSILIAAALMVSPQLHAEDLSKLNHQCAIKFTDNDLDLALDGSGYFIVASSGGRDQQLFTRFGTMFLDQNGYITSQDGYLLAVDKKSDFKHLRKIKISDRNLAPKATRKLELNVNLPANAAQEDYFENKITIYDSVANTHDVIIKSTKTGQQIWDIKVFVDKVARGEGRLVFNSDGTLNNQEGLHHIQWPTDYSMNKLTVDLSQSTQYVSEFSTQFMKHDGYGVGRFQSLRISMLGEVILIYHNGVEKMLKDRIALAMFTNPRYLKSVTGRLFKPTEKSGQPSIHWKNSEYTRIVSKALEDEDCLLEQAG